MIDSPGPPGTNRHWWFPRPLALVVTMAVGGALSGFATYDKQLGKPPVAEYGWPMTYRVEPRSGYGAPNTPSQFYPAAVVIDISIAFGLVASTCFTTQFLCSLGGITPRYTLRTICLLIAAIALLLAVCRYAWQLAVLAWLAVLCYGILSPALMAIVLLRSPLTRLFHLVDRLMSRFAD